MREIKFRAWVNGAMIYPRKDYHLQIQEPFSWKINDRVLGCQVASSWDNKENVLMQFTGLLDKNGKEIWEGDLLDFDEKEWGAKFIPEIMAMENLTGEWGYCGTLNDVKEWRQVIGNIYENPELLEAQ